MDKTKCITFDKEAQNSLPEYVKEKMKAQREKAREEVKQRYSAAFMYACPLRDKESKRCSLRPITRCNYPLDCTPDCGAIKDFFNYLETNQ